MAKLGLEKIMVRRIVPGDRPMLRHWLNGPGVRQAIEDEHIDFSKLPETMEWFESSDPFCDSALGLIIEAMGEPIGLIHFACINWINRNAEVIVLVGPGELRCSLGAAIVVEKVGHVAFRMLNLHKIYAFVYASNQGALSVFRKLMREEARLQNYVKSNHDFGDLHLFGLLASEYFLTIEKFKKPH